MEYQDVDTGILIEHVFNFLNPRVFNGQKEAHSPVNVSTSYVLEGVSKLPDS